MKIELGNAMRCIGKLLLIGILFTGCKKDDAHDVNHDNGSSEHIMNTDQDFQVYHPQWLGARIMWTDGMHEVEFARVDYDVRERSEYIDSPANEIHDGATEVRENLERDVSLGRKHAVYDEMRSKGLTDYVAWPLYHTLGKRHMVTFATDRPGGFDDAHIIGLLKLLPVLALVSEIRMKNRLARTLLETYVGSHASELVLDGAE